MKQLYIDCTNGISSDMLLKALFEAGGMAEPVVIFDSNGKAYRSHVHTSYKKVCEIIRETELPDKVKEMALNIYGVIARAEAHVHGEFLETVHFHEVGRPAAISNILCICQALSSLEVDEILCSVVHDGHGTVECSHGIIPVPVPAVAAMMKDCDLQFATDDIETEMVTPSGLGVLIGIGAHCVDPMPADFSFAGIGRGTRDIGRDGLKVFVKGEKND